MTFAFFPLVPGCIMVQSNSSVCVSLNINSQSNSRSLRGQYCCVNGWKIAWKTDEKSVVTAGTKSLMMQFLNCPAEGICNVKRQNTKGKTRRKILQELLIHLPSDLTGLFCPALLKGSHQNAFPECASLAFLLTPVKPQL